MAKWKSLADEKPPYHTDVLILDHGIGGQPEIAIGSLLEAHRDYNEQWLIRMSPWVREPVYHRVTHWMPLPEVPTARRVRGTAKP